MDGARKPRTVGLALTACALITGCSADPLPWTEGRPQRVVVALDDVRWATESTPVVVSLAHAPGNIESIRVSEIDADGTVLDAEAPFQFDPAVEGGELTLLVGGDEANTTDRRYVVYFDDGGEYTPTSVDAHVEATVGIEHKGQASVRIATASGTWFYHLQGAGFASLIDNAGKDWLGYGAGRGALGEYRGMPNLVYPEGYFHPGGTECVTRVTASGPLRVVLDSRCGEGAWAVRWEVFGLHARMTVLRAEHPYWFLYEGTPGGALDVQNDYYVLSDGTRFSAGEPRDGDLPQREWLYFGDPASERVLWLAHDGNDKHPDAYYPMDDAMTVFGFGRSRVRSFLSAVPARFVVGLAPESDHAQIAEIVEAALAGPRIHVGPVEEKASMD